MGACAITGGLYIDSYNVLPGVDGIIPVDVYVPGCPPRPETLIQVLCYFKKRSKGQRSNSMSKSNGSPSGNDKGDVASIVASNNDLPTTSVKQGETGSSIASKPSRQQCCPVKVRED